MNIDVDSIYQAELARVTSVSPDRPEDMLKLWALQGTKTKLGAAWLEENPMPPRQDGDSEMIYGARRLEHYQAQAAAVTEIMGAHADMLRELSATRGAAVHAARIVLGHHVETKGDTQ